jgi:creatinine amidohydrolase
MRLVPLIVLGMLCIPRLVFAAAGSVMLEELTWIELRDRVQAGSTTILVPVGGTEQNGPHMVLGKHNVRAKALAGMIATRLGDALVAPVVSYVPEGSLEPPSQHMRFPGTITLPADVFEKTLESAARSFRAHGFHDVVLLGDHGGYQASLRKVADRLNREWARSATRVHVPREYYEAADAGFPALLERGGFSKADIGSHAGLADTSLSLAVDASLVRSARLRDASAPGSAQGVTGDPRKASAELGQAGVELIVTRTAEAIAKVIRARRVAPAPNVRNRESAK